MHQKYDIVLADLNPVKWSEQAGIRPCLIIQNNRANKVSRTFVIAIITSTIKKYPHTVIVDPTSRNWLSNQSRIDMLQIRTIDESRIIKSLWSLDTEYQALVDKAVAVAFDV